MTKGAVSRRGGAPPRVHATGARGRCCVTFLSISLSLSGDRPCVRPAGRLRMFVSYALSAPYVCAWTHGFISAFYKCFS